MKILSINEIHNNSKEMKSQVYKFSLHNKYSAGFRISNNNFVNIFKKSKFSINKSHKIFTIGSCFAREIENKLNELEFNIVNFDFSLPDKYKLGGRWAFNEEYKKLGFTQESERSILNKYSIRSMIDAIDISFKINDIKIVDYLIELQGKFYNPYQHFNIGMGLNDAEILFKKCMTQYKMVELVDFVIITLGQTELWRDKQTEKFINGAPPTLGFHKDSSRFEFVMPELVDVKNDLDSLINLIKDKNPGARIILTVSPVPLSRTFAPEDSITSNIRSKSTLLVLAREMADKFEYIDYFPSYEMVTHSNRNWAIEPDMVHVMPRCVDLVVSEFVKSYLDDDLNTR